MDAGGVELNVEEQKRGRMRQAFHLSFNHYVSHETLHIFTDF
jgi:hypothetical protein